MNDKVTIFVKAFLALSADERKSVLAITAEMAKAAGPLNESRIAKSFGLENFESATTINFAPLPGTCSKCGR
ncbi:hypothetical protein ACTUVN_002380 [Pseudomonas caspiana]